MISQNPFRKLILDKIEAAQDSRVRSVLKIAQWTMGISFAILITASAIIRGFHDEISTKIFNFWGHVHVTSTDFLQTLESSPILWDSSFVNEIRQLQSFQNEAIDTEGKWISGTKDEITVEDMRVFITLPVMVESKKEYEGLFLKASDPQVFNGHSEYLIAGQYPDQRKEEREILVSEHSAQRLQLTLGDYLLVHWIRKGKQKTQKLKVSGIYKTGLMEYDKAFAFTDLEFLQKLQNWEKNQVSGYEIVLSDAEKSEAFNQYIFYEHLPLQWYSTSVTQKFRNIFQWLAMQSQNEVVLLFLLGAVVLINLATVLLILIIDRIRMIGILKSLGASLKDIRMIFFSLGLKILMRSLLIGNVLGLGICLVQKYFKIFKLSEEDYYLKHVPIQLDFSYLLIFNLGIVFIVGLFMLIPASYIQKIDPVKILRFD